MIASYVGDGAPILIQRALGAEAGDEALIRKGLQYFLSYYREHKLDHTTVYPGIAETLKAIHNSNNGRPRKLAVLTNKPVIPARAIVEALGLGPFFFQIYGGNSFPTKKPEPEGVLQLLAECRIPASQAAIVGDSHVDVHTGRNAGLSTIGVTYGFAPHTLNQETPDVLVDTPAELRTVFQL